ncbi:MAG: glutaminyl-peptide cyclotransferase [Gemmatimonadales bacterium]
MATAVGYALAVLIAACSAQRPANYTLVRSFPHDDQAFTEGLVYAGGRLYESVGLYGQSQLRRVDLATGRVLAAVPLAANRFGEGLALLDGKLFQLTWKSGTGYVYDAGFLTRVDSFRFAGEGWGLTTDGTSLIMTNGSSELRFIDPRTFAITRTLTVTSNSLLVQALNELEYVRGTLYANVYQTTSIVRIDPQSGVVLQWIDLSGLVPKAVRGSNENVLNGIAFDSASGDLLVTGKRWPRLFEIRTKQR